MASKRDYYEVLGVERSATQDEIKRTYRRLARQYHPDVSQEADAETRFKEINEAYEVLSDTDKRAAYDRFGHAGPGMGGFGFETGFRDPFDIFEEVFGGGFGGMGFRTSSSRQRGPRRGADLRYELRLKFEEAVFGVEKTLEVTRHEVCPHCNGGGAEPGTTPVRCAECNGSGQVRRVQRSILGSFVSVTTCPVCPGEGETVPTPCTRCGGERQVLVTRERTVTIPAGVDDGMQIRVTGEGEMGVQGGSPGNLYVVLEVEPHPVFQRRGDDILVELSVNVAQAALGADVRVPTLEQEDTVTIPPGTQNGTVLRLRSKGVPHLKRDGRGDELVMVRVAVPNKLTGEQRDLLKKLGETLEPETVWREKRGFLDDLRELFGL
ncbi:MAG: molecular chaperone DnaJ [Anaerolineales bacterium]|nr:molecular chaperone DnaJ [Anaerolineales bacterium]